METKVAQFVNKGMMQDLSKSKSSNEFAFENHNIRITTEGNNSLLSITNEKGNSKINIIPGHSTDDYYIVYVDTLPLNTYPTDYVLIVPDKNIPEHVFINFKFLGVDLNTGKPKEEEYLNKDLGDEGYMFRALDVYNLELVTKEINGKPVYFLPRYCAKEIIPKIKDIAPPIDIEGITIGHAIIDNSIVLFTTNSYGKDCIYRLDYLSSSKSFIAHLLYKGDLNFSLYNPIETLTSYEGEDVQKVYWVDGINSPRVINIKNDNIDNTNNYQFDFIPNFKHPAKGDITIEKQYEGTGLFSPGTIQYVFTYFNKYGQESNIIYSSNINYITFKDRGAKADETCDCSFKISLNNLDPNFNYIRIYSIKKTSENDPGTAAIVADLATNSNSTITFVDTNKNNIPIDINTINFLESKDITASTIEEKDNVLFLGDLKLKDLLKEDKEKLTKLSKTIDVHFEYRKKISDTSNKQLYSYNPELSLDASKVKTFKYGETYRIGIQYQTNKGQWTQAFWVKDVKCDKYPKYNSENNSSIIETACLVGDVSAIKDNLPSSIVAYRLLYVIPTENDRSIVAQGIVNPTIFNQKQRYDNQVYSANSGFIKPITHELYVDQDDTFNKHFFNIQNKLSTDIEIEGLYNRAIDIKGGKVTGSLGINSSRYVKNGYITNPDYSNKKEKKYELETKFVLRVQCQGAMYLGKVTCYTTVYDPITKKRETIQIKEPKFHSKTSRYKIYDWARNYLSNFKYDKSSTFIDKDGNYHTSGDYVFTFLHLSPSSDAFYINWDVYNDTIGKGIKPGTWYFENTEIKSSEGVDWINQYIEETATNYFIDANTVTLNSPELDNTSININNSSLKFRIVGYAPINKAITDYSIKLDTSQNLIEKPVLNFNFSGNNYPKSGLKTFPLVIQEGKSGKDTSSASQAYVISPFMRETIFQEGEGDTKKYCKIKHKVISNLWYSNSSYYYMNDNSSDNEESTPDEFPICWEPPVNNENIVHLYNSNEFDILKLNDKNNYYLYYGNYDSGILYNRKLPVLSDLDGTSSLITKEMLNPKFAEICRKYNYGLEYNPDAETPINFFTTDNPFIKIQYKSTPHALIKFKNIGHEIILPNYAENSEVSLIKNSEEIYTFNSSQYLKGDFTKPCYSDNTNVVTGDNIISLNINSCSIIPSTKEGEEGLYRTSTIAVSNISKVNLGSIIKYNYSESDSNHFKFYTILGIEEIWSSGSGASITGYILVLNEFPHVLTTLKYKSEDDTPFKYSTLIPELVYGNKVFKEDVFFNNNKYYYENSNYSFNVKDRVNIYPSIDITQNSLWIGELYRDIDESSLYGGNSENAKENNIYSPISQAVSIDEKAFSNDGDTFYQRWDCLRTYPAEDTKGQNIVDIVSFMVESHKNLDARTDTNRKSIINRTARPSNFNLFNKVYDTKNNKFVYTVLDDKFNNTDYPNQITWTLSKTSLADIDNWTKISLASIIDLDASKGNITKLKRWNNRLLAFQERGIAEINFNNLTAISNASGVPVEIQNSNRVNGKTYISSNIGCYNKWSIAESIYGLYFIDSYNKTFNLFNGQILPLGEQKGFKDWFEKNITLNIWNPEENTGFKVSYDSNNKDIYITNKYFSLCFSEYLQQFSSFYDYQKSPTMFNFKDIFIGLSIKKLTNVLDGTLLWNQFTNTEYCNFYNEDSIRKTYYPYYVSYIINPEPLKDKIFNNLEYRSDIINKDNVLTNKTFDTLHVENEYQEGDLNLSYSRNSLSSASPKFRIWRTLMPRDKNDPRGLNRIRNPWIKLTLSKKEDTKDKLEFHDLLVKYFS